MVMACGHMQMPHDRVLERERGGPRIAQGLARGHMKPYDRVKGAHAQQGGAKARF